MKDEQLQFHLILNDVCKQEGLLQSHLIWKMHMIRFLTVFCFGNTNSCNEDLLSDQLSKFSVMNMCHLAGFSVLSSY